MKLFPLRSFPDMPELQIYSHCDVTNSFDRAKLIWMSWKFIGISMQLMHFTNCRPLRSLHDRPMFKINCHIDDTICLTAYSWHAWVKSHCHFDETYFWRPLLDRPEVKIYCYFDDTISLTANSWSDLVENLLSFSSLTAFTWSA